MNPPLLTNMGGMQLQARKILDYQLRVQAIAQKESYKFSNLKNFLSMSDRRSLASISPI